MKTINDWNLHSWYRTRDCRKAWLAAIAIGPDGEPVCRMCLKFFVRDVGLFDTDLNGRRFNEGDNLDIIEPWVDETRPLGRYCPVKHPPTEVDGEHVLVGGGLPFPYTAHTRCVLELPAAYKWWCPLKPILEMEVSE